MICVLARIIRFGISPGTPTAEYSRCARELLKKFASKEIVSESEKGHFRRLAPVLDEYVLWRVGSRVCHHVPFTMDSKLPVLLPTSHIISLQIMCNAHCLNHLAEDGTLCRFRLEGYWVVRAGFLAKRVASASIPCCKNSKKVILSLMGGIIAEKLKQPVAWGHCQMDLFGPFHCRGDVNPRTT